MIVDQRLQMFFRSLPVAYCQAAIEFNTQIFLFP